MLPGRSGYRKSPLDFFDSLHNASLFCLLRSPKSCRGAAQTPAAAGFLQAFDSTRRGLPNTVAALRFAGHFGLQIVPLPRNRLAFSATGGASALSPSYSPCETERFFSKQRFFDKLRGGLHVRLFLTALSKHAFHHLPHLPLRQTVGGPEGEGKAVFGPQGHPDAAVISPPLDRRVPDG